MRRWRRRSLARLTGATTSEAAVKPFSTVTIGDANGGATDTLTISYTAADGTLSGTGLSGRARLHAERDGGDDQRAIEGLTFTPVDGVPNTAKTTTFTLSDQSSAFATATVNSATKVADTDPAVAQPVVSDFNGDGYSDIAFQDTADNAVAVWEMKGALIIAKGAAVLGDPPSGWKVIGSGDFYNDTSSDLLFQNSSTGQLAYWGVSQGSNGPKLNSAQTATLPNDPGSSWHAIAAGDFTGDGLSGIAFQNTDGAIAVWEMDGSSIITHGSAVLGNPGTSWQLRATGDFYGDGVSDLVLQNTNEALAIWGISQGASGPTLNMAQTIALPENPGPSWQLEGTGDVNGDGKSDLIFQNTANGEVAVWEMNGASILGSAVVDLPANRLEGEIDRRL